MRRFNNIFTEFEQEALMDALEGWEIVEFLQIPAEVIMRTAIEDGWLSVETAAELLEFADITRGDEE